MSCWAQETWRAYRDAGMQGEPLRHAASNQFRARGLQPGDDVYVVVIDDGQLLLVGRVSVDSVVDEDEAERQLGDDLYEARDHVIGQPPFSTVRFDRLVPERDARELETEDGKRIKFSSRSEYRIAPMALVTARWLNAESVVRLDSLLHGT